MAFTQGSRDTTSSACPVCVSRGAVWIWWQLDDGRAKGQLPERDALGPVLCQRRPSFLTLGMFWLRSTRAVLLDLWRPRLVLRALYQRVSDGVMELALASGLGRGVMRKRSPRRRELWLKDRDRAQRGVVHLNE